MNRQLEDIKQRLAARTPGNWQFNRVYEDTIFEVHNGTVVVCQVDGTHNSPAEQDAVFITHAPADIAYLLSEIERLFRLLDRPHLILS